MVEHLFGQGEDGSRIPFTCGCSTCKETDIRQLPPWQKVLYIQQPYTDNHTDTLTFLADMVLNADVSNPSYWPTVEASLVVAHEVATVAMVVSVFAFRYMDVLSLHSLHSLNLSFILGGLALAAIADVQASRAQSRQETVIHPGTDTAGVLDGPAVVAVVSRPTGSPQPAVTMSGAYGESSRAASGFDRNGVTQNGRAMPALRHRIRSVKLDQLEGSHWVPDGPDKGSLDGALGALSKGSLVGSQGVLRGLVNGSPEGCHGVPREAVNGFREGRQGVPGQDGGPNKKQEATQLLHTVYWRLKRWSSCLLACGLLALHILLLSPVLHTLTRSISSDTIWCTTSYLLLLHLYLHDYSYSAALTSAFSSYLALLSALFACVLLASRLPDPGNAFAFISFGLQCFGLLPAILQRVGQASERSHQVVVLLLLFLSLGLVWLLSPLLGLALTSLLLFVVLVCPAILVYMHRRYKSSIRGPWDEAKLKAEHLS